MKNNIRKYAEDLKKIDKPFNENNLKKTNINLFPDKKDGKLQKKYIEDLKKVNKPFNEEGIEHFKTITNMDPLLYATIPKDKTITFNDMKLKYPNLFSDSDRANFDNILNETSKKKAICAIKKTESDPEATPSIIVRIPQPKDFSTGKGQPVLNDFVNYFNKSIGSIKDFISDNSRNKMTEKDCRQFMTVYCEQVKKDLSSAYSPDYKNSHLLEYAPECACFQKTMEENLGEKLKWFTETEQDTIRNQPKSCQFKECSANQVWNSDEKDTGECKGITLCSNIVRMEDLTAGGNINTKIELNNNCGAGEGGNSGPEIPKTPPTTPDNGSGGSTPDKGSGGSSSTPDKGAGGSSSTPDKGSGNSSSEDSSESDYLIYYIIGIILCLCCVIIFVVIIIIIFRTSRKQQNIY